MKNKAFTLIELLAVIVILGVIALIATPIITNVLKDSKEEVYKVQINLIEKAARAWAVDNHFILPENEGEVITITLGQLKEEGYIGKKIINPITNQEFNDDMEILITWINNSYEYKVIDDPASGNGNQNELLISLNGPSIQYVEIGEAYIELGVVATNKDGTINENITIVIKSNDEELPNIETNRLGEYKVIYTVWDGSDFSSAIRAVIVRDTTPPVLTIPGDIIIKENEVENFDLMDGVSWTDNSEEEVTIEVSGNISAIEGTYTITYTATDQAGNKTIKNRIITVEKPDFPPGYDGNNHVNKPQLTSGMVPIKWNGTTEIITTEADEEWYDYSNKKWANAKTADGSYWGWIPRYAYKILSCYNMNYIDCESATGKQHGEFGIVFLQGTTNQNINDTIIETSGYQVGIKDTSQHYFLHPAFNQGGEEVLGYWVAKFKASGTTSNLNIVPNVSSLRDLKIEYQFDAAYNMRNNSKYGWDTSKVDPHMMTNLEWGAVAYLTHSIYGKNSEVWINNNRNYITGCAGASAVAENTTDCNPYNSINGQQASTTGNITGIYDMSGGGNEYVAAYINNGHTVLMNGYNIVHAENKYKTVYLKSSNDSAISNYDFNKNIYGDAVYETSGSHTGQNSWNRDYSYMPYGSSPWFRRGGNYSDIYVAGIFQFNTLPGNGNAAYAFRVTLRIN